MPINTTQYISPADVCAIAGTCGANNKFRVKGFYANLGGAPFDKLLTCCDAGKNQFETQEGPATGCKSGECFYNDAAYQEKCDKKLGCTYTSCGFVNNACNSPADCDDPLINPPPPDPVTEKDKYPIILLDDAPYITIPKDSTWTDPGWIAWENSEDNTGDISSSVIVSDPVNTSVPRIYTVYYRVINSLGWSDTETRIVEVLP